MKFVWYINNNWRDWETDGRGGRGHAGQCYFSVKSMMWNQWEVRICPPFRESLVQANEWKGTHACLVYVTYTQLKLLLLGSSSISIVSEKFMVTSTYANDGFDRQEWLLFFSLIILILIFHFQKFIANILKANERHCIERSAPPICSFTFAAQKAREDDTLVHALPICLAI